MLHKNYVATVNDIYNKTIEFNYSYKLVANAVEQIDRKIIQNEDMFIQLYKMKYGSPTFDELYNFGRESFGRYYASIFMFYFKCLK